MLILLKQRKRVLYVLVFTFAVCIGAKNLSAGIIGALGPLRAIANEKFEVDFFLQAKPSFVGSAIELINIDMIKSQVNGSPLDPNLVRFDASTRDHDFASWQAGSQFGASDIPNYVTLAVADPMDPNDVYVMTSAPFLVGTFTVDYSTLGLSLGDSVTLDITGVDDMGSKTTSVWVTSINDFEDPDFSTTLGPAARTFTLSSGPPPPPPPVPEPGSFMIALCGVLVLSRMRRRRTRSVASSLQSI